MFFCFYVLCVSLFCVISRAVCCSLLCALFNYFRGVLFYVYLLVLCGRFVCFVLSVIRDFVVVCVLRVLRSICVCVCLCVLCFSILCDFACCLLLFCYSSYFYVFRNVLFFFRSSCFVWSFCVFLG